MRRLFLTRCRGSRLLHLRRCGDFGLVSRHKPAEHHFLGAVREHEIVHGAKVLEGTVVPAVFLRWLLKRPVSLERLPLLIVDVPVVFQRQVPDRQWIAGSTVPAEVVDVKTSVEEPPVAVQATAPFAQCKSSSYLLWPPGRPGRLQPGVNYLWPFRRSIIRFSLRCHHSSRLQRAATERDGCFAQQV